MQRPIARGAAAGAGLIFHVFAQDSASTSGAGKASIAYGSWACRYIRNGEAISGAITPEDISTIGTYAAPTANTNLRIKAVDNTNMIGVYELQIHADWVNTTNTCQSLTIYLTATGVATLPLQIPLVGYNPQDGVRLGLTALPNAAADAAGGLVISDAGGLDADAQRADVAAILVDTGTTLDNAIDALPTAAENAVALMTPAVSTWEDAADVRSLAVATMKAVHKIAPSGATLQIFKTNDTTVKAEQALTTDAALEPVSAIGGTTAP